MQEKSKFHLCGDVLSIRDEDDKEVGSYEYDAYGNVLAVEGNIAKDNPIRYAGYYYDEETKNYYLQARYYNSENGSFLALDPHPGYADEPLSQNGYTYVENNPISFIDPDGNNPVVIYSILAQVVRFASPLLQRNGKEATAKIVKYTRKLLGKMPYQITSSSNSILVIIDKKSKDKNKRIFSIGYHSISLVDKKTNKKVPKSVWHYHLGRHKLDKKGKQMKGTGGYVHHIFRWSMPKGYKIQNNSNYKYA
ncbi:RHS repeat domain-containing protein [Peribacillus muralis]|uniref:RHS repeat domain-containing protein n=1 Tax=Peribacillus muralis TaxID=264697 RepID=UPI003CFEA355